MRALVTGGAGFIGGHLSEALLNRADEVTIIDSLTDYYDPRLKRTTAERLSSQGALFIEKDLNEIDLEPLLDVDVIFHQAGQPGVRKSWGSDFTSYIAANIATTQRLLEAVRAANATPRIVYASSSSVYGTAESYPTTECTLPRPRSPYGVTKLAGEHLVSLYAENFGLDTLSLRYFTVYGPGQRPDMAFTRFTRAALEGAEIQLYGDGSQIRDFTFVGDVVSANLLAAEAATEPGAVFNVSGGSSCSISDVLRIVTSITGRALNVRRLPAVDGDVERTGGDSTLLTQTTGWEPATGLEAGLRAQVEWMESMLAEAGR